MDLNVPDEFKKLCRSFGPDLSEFASTPDELVRHVLSGLSVGDAAVIRTFLESLLASERSDNDLVHLWWSMPVTTVFHDAADVRWILQRLRGILSDTPFLSSETQISPPK